jgi:hypothetical protein
VKIYFILASLISILLLFQNCGDTARSTTIFADQYLSSNGCQTLDCSTSENLLWMQIREYEPYRVQYATLGSHFNVGGQCGIGTFKNHSFLWELREGFGTQRVISTGYSDNRCNLGQFQVPIIFNSIIPNPDQRYQLTMEIVGISSSGEQIANSLPASRSSLDVIFTTSAP